jgi:phage host-nuclease inhibitor protein Gam
MKRRKIETREELNDTVADIARLTVEANRLRAEMDERLLVVKERYVASLAAMHSAIKAKVAAAKVWAKKNPAKFGDAKSLVCGLGTIGFRTGTPKVSLLDGWTVEKVIEAVLGLFPKRGYVRVKEELDKEALIADRDKLTLCECHKMGIEIGQEETFFVDIDMERASGRYGK